MSLKLVINKKSKKVVYAESGYEFVDFLFNTFYFPLGSMNQYLISNSKIGFITESNESTTSLLPPPLITNDATIFLQKSTYGATSSGSICLYTCSKHHMFSDSDYARCTSDNCGEMMWNYISYNGSGHNSRGKEGGDVKEEAKFIISDDLMIQFISTEASMALLTEAGVSKPDDLEEVIVEVGQKERVMLMMETWKSDEILTNVFLKKECTKSEGISSTMNRAWNFSL